MKHSLSAAAAGLLALGLAPAHAQGGAPASGVTRRTLARIVVSRKVAGAMLGE